MSAERKFRSERRNSNNGVYPYEQDLLSVSGPVLLRAEMSMAPHLSVCSSRHCCGQRSAGQTAAKRALQHQQTIEQLHARRKVRCCITGWQQRLQSWHAAAFLRGCFAGMSGDAGQCMRDELMASLRDASCWGHGGRLWRS